jgi:hypothetical protein
VVRGKAIVIAIAVFLVIAVSGGGIYYFVDSYEKEVARQQAELEKAEQERIAAERLRSEEEARQNEQRKQEREEEQKQVAAENERLKAKILEKSKQETGNISRDNVKDYIIKLSNKEMCGIPWGENIQALPDMERTDIKSGTSGRNQVIYKRNNDQYQSGPVPSMYVFVNNRFAGVKVFSIDGMDGYVEIVKEIRDLFGQPDFGTRDNLNFAWELTNIGIHVEYEWKEGITSMTVAYIPLIPDFLDEKK